MPSGADPFPIFVPSMATIVGITRNVNATIQTAFPHTFLVGESVRILVPQQFGMTQMNNIVGNITFISPLLPSFFRTDIDSSSFDAFVVPVNPTQSAQAIPVGENALMLTGATHNVLPYP